MGTMGYENRQINQYLQIIDEGIKKLHTFVPPEDASYHKPYNNKIQDYGKQYDYIIVGGGSAGTVIASRLSENVKTSVLLLEAGGIEDAFINVPGLDIYSYGLEYNWNYKTTPQSTSCLGMTNNQCAYQRGKGVGGSSLINALMYVRGNKGDFDNWYQLGNSGWNYTDVLPYFKKSENFTIKGDEGYHGTSGNYNVEYHMPSSPQLNAFIKSNIELKQNVVDYNGKTQLGISKTQHNTINGKRLSTSKAFLVPVLSRENLELLTRSYVTKIRLDNVTKTALGVIFTHNGVRYSVSAKKEVIISAGVIASPQILMLSGIGPKEQLIKHGIEVVIDLPVGKWFYDHPLYHGLHFSTNYTEPLKLLERHVEEFLKGYGKLAIPSNAQAVGFYKSKLNKDLFSQIPDFELILQPSSDSIPNLQTSHRYTKLAFDSLWGKQNSQNSFSFGCILLHPKSFGSVKLKSNDPYEYPLIDLNSLSDKKNEDIELLYELSQFALKLSKTKAFQKLNATLSHFPYPPCISDHQFLSKKYWFCHIRHYTSHLYHGSSTCRMGLNTTESVVDNQLRVHGIKNLRIIDASIFPTSLSGHNNAAVIMIAEKASDLIKNSK
ncbi:hypothetical protein FQR65_LT08158 [Abscondita terminalis]|nr:hypothetical protein FQR65_LT08158 [Abscondita terminalis]